MSPNNPGKPFNNDAERIAAAEKSGGKLITKEVETAFSPEERRHVVALAKDDNISAQQLSIGVIHGIGKCIEGLYAVVEAMSVDRSSPGFIDKYGEAHARMLEGAIQFALSTAQEFDELAHNTYLEFLAPGATNTNKVPK